MATVAIPHAIRVSPVEKMKTGTNSPVTRGLRSGKGVRSLISAGCSRTLDRNQTAPVGAYASANSPITLMP